MLIKSSRTNKKSKEYFCCQLGTFSVPFASTDLALRCTVLYSTGSPSEQRELCDDMTGRWLIRLAWRFQGRAHFPHEAHLPRCASCGNWALPFLSALGVGSWQMLPCLLLCLTWMTMRLGGICVYGGNKAKQYGKNGLNILTFAARGGVLGVNLVSF